MRLGVGGKDMILKRWLLILGFVLGWGLGLSPDAVCASVVGFSLGPAAPPGMLGPYAMTPFPLDSQPQGSWTSAVVSPLGGTVDFSSPVMVCQAETSWFDWGQGYTGSVYYTGGFYAGGNLAYVTLTLPAGTAAFYVYAQPLHYATWQITAMAQDGTAVTQDVYDAAGFWFYGTAGSVLQWITLSTAHMDGFGLGEFGIAAVPTPGAFLLGALGMGLIGCASRRRAWRP
jgi:hypothetical protein